MHGSFLSRELRGLPDGHWLLDPAVTGPSLSLADLAVHWFDLVEHVTGARVDAVLAQSSAPRADAVPFRHGAIIALRLDNGGVGDVAISQDCVGFDDELVVDVYGSRGSARWSLRADGERLALGLDEQGLLTERTLAPTWEDGTAEAFGRLMADLYERIRGEGGDGAPTFADGRRGVALLDAALASAERQGWATVPAATA